MHSDLEVLCAVSPKIASVDWLDEDISKKFVEILLVLDLSKRKLLFELSEKFDSATESSSRSIFVEAMLCVLSTVGESVVTVPNSSVPECDELGLQRWRTKVGQKVTTLRTNLGFTQAVLAEKTRIQQSHISRIESGRVSPTHLTVRKLAAALRVSPSKIDPNFPDD